MVVIISWVAFWINRDSAPARVTLGIMTVLTMTTLMTTTNRQMPKVSYIKAVDIYLGVCYVMVFAALLEYAAVSYSNKKLQDRKKKRQSSQVATSSGAHDAAVTTELLDRVNQNTPYQAQVTLSGQQREHYLNFEMLPREQDTVGHAFAKPHITIAVEPAAVYSRPASGRSRVRLFNFLKLRRGRSDAAGSSDKRLQMVASGIDKYSRIGFPVAFGLFNIVYWTIFLKESGKI